MKETLNYKLRKPDQEDFYNVDDFNYNADVIDTKLKENADAIAQHANAAAPHSGHALVNHTHSGSDITSAVASANNADTVDGKHASDFIGIINNNITLTIPTDFPTVQAALDYLRDKFIPSNVTVTIQINAGTYNHTTPIIINHPCGNQIKIIGATPVTTTITGVGTITGAAGNWRVPIAVASSSGIATGDYVIIKDTTGTGNYYVFRGIWKVISVDSPTQITVQNTHQASSFPMATLSGGTVVTLKTILQFADCKGIVIVSYSSLKLLNNIALIGNNSNNEGLVLGRIPDDLNAPGPAYLILGSNFGVNGFGLDGIWVGYGSVLATYGYMASSGNGRYGIYVEHNGLATIGYCMTTGNKEGGIAAFYNSSVYAYGSSIVGNKTGFLSALGSFIYAENATSLNNTDIDYKATQGSFIYARGYNTSSTFSPSVNTIGNANSMISTT